MKPRIAYRSPDWRGLQHEPIFIARVMAKWDAKEDTAQIAAELLTPEATVAAALVIGRDSRRGKP